MKLLVVLLALVVVAFAAKGGKYVASGIKERATDCGAGTFQCRSGRCIQEEWVCDTDNDCLDGSDEVNCPTDCSGQHQFNCKSSYHTCIPSEYRCDGKNDCPNNADELDCDREGCSQYERKCEDNLTCVESSWFCDGNIDCSDGSDEQECASCQPGFFRCTSPPQCIREMFVCDGDKDCDDHSDEALCSSASPFCDDKHPVYLCELLNKTGDTPICLDKPRAISLCRRYCNFC